MSKINVEKNVVQEFDAKRTIAISIILCIVLVMILEVFSLYIVWKFTHPPIRQQTNNIQKYNIDNYKRVKFKSAKGNVEINGYFIKNNRSNNSIIICHGYGDNKFFIGGKSTPEKIDNLKLAKLFINQGYSVLIFDFRGHGECGKNAAVTLGFNEQEDLLGAIQFLKKHNLAKKVGVFGASMGAATTLSVLDKTNSINFVIADSPFSDLKEYVNCNIGVWTGLPRIPFAPMVIGNFKIVYGVDFSKISPIKSVSKTKVPILLIHVKKDKTIPYTESIKIKNKFKNQNSKLSLYNNSAHVGSYYIYPEEYEKNIIEFLKKV